MEYKARCHCGRVRFSFRSPEIKAGKRCNCSLCIRRGAVLSSTYIPAADFTPHHDLRDLGLYGPVAEIVRAHHERIDGRGYPDGLKGDDIPELAKLVAVAETYDTLTADDTYRTPISSFEALTELRRVSGTQLDPVYVEALAKLLTGRGVDYRHANRADFDVELDVERRINDSVGISEAAAR